MDYYRESLVKMVGVFPNLLCPFRPVAQIRALLKAPGPLKIVQFPRNKLHGRHNYLVPLVPMQLVMLKRRQNMVLKLVGMTAGAVAMAGLSTKIYEAGVGQH